jgi:hypothetical protein
MIKYDIKNNVHIYNTNLYNFNNIIKNIYTNYFKCNIELEEIHNLLNTTLINKEDKEYYSKIPYFGINDRDSIFIKIFHKYYDSSDEFFNLYKKFILNYIKPTFFPDEEYIVIQKTPNIRFHLPNCSNIGKRDSDPNNKIIGLHYDYEFNHDENEINMILPITNMYDTNSFYFEPYKNSNILFENYQNLKLNNNNIAFLYLNKWKHYNMINTTDKTRISFDIRIIPYSKYYDNNKNSKTNKKKLIIGDYFIKL